MRALAFVLLTTCTAAGFLGGYEFRAHGERTAIRTFLPPNCPITSEETQCNIAWLWAIAAENQTEIDRLRTK